MRLLVVHNRYLQSGGEDAVFLAETSLLQKQGHSVETYLDHNRRIKELGLLPAAIHTIWSDSSRRQIREILLARQPEVAHFHNTFLLISPAAYHACQSLGVPVVQTLHNYRLLCPTATMYRDEAICEDCLGNTPPLAGVLHACYHKSRLETAVIATMLTLHRFIGTWRDEVEVYIALTEFARLKFIEGGLPAEKIVVKPNFLQPDPGQGEHCGPYALFVGRLSPEKGIWTLLRAWQHLDDIPLRIFGEGPLSDEIRNCIERYGLTQVECKGRCSHKEILAQMQEARLLVFPSEWYEGFPMTLVEAFACGLPVITSGLGSMQEIVTDKETGLHFEAGNAEDLAKKVELLWSHTHLAKEMGSRARLEFENQYTAERNYELLTKIYERAIASHRK